MAMIELSSLAETARLGKELANLLRESVLPIFFSGELGTGKTTLIRYLAQALPGGENAEVSSPSFNICNYYPTLPETLHCDLYRCGSSVPDEVENAIFSDNKLALVEWANFLPASLKPPIFLDISLTVRNNTRFATLLANGGKAQAIVDTILNNIAYP